MKTLLIGSLAVVGCLGIACSSAVSNDSGTGGAGATNNTGGTSTGVGGTSTNTGGTSTGVGGTSTNTGGTSTTTGGTSTGVGGTSTTTGGTSTGVGGTSTNTGGTSTNTGGTTSASVECTGTSFAPEYGFYDNGTFCGYGFTYAFETGGTVVPEENFDDVATGLCIDGEIPASDEEAGTYPGIAVGVNLRQNSAGDEALYTAAGSGITVSYDDGGGTAFQANIVHADGSRYCAELSGSGSDTLAWSDFAVECWDAATPTLSAGDELEAFHLQVQPTDMDQTISGACLTGLSEN